MPFDPSKRKRNYRKENSQPRWVLIGWPIRVRFFFRLKKWEKEVELIKQKKALYDLELDSKATFADYPLSAQERIIQYGQFFISVQADVVRTVRILSGFTVRCLSRHFGQNQVQIRNSDTRKSSRLKILDFD